MRRIALSMGISPDNVIRDTVELWRLCAPQNYIVARRSPQDYREYVHQYGIEPTVDVLFELDKFANLEAQRRCVFAFTAALLSELPGDLLLRFIDTPVLLRRGGELQINSAAHVSTDEQRLFPMPYSMVHIDE